MFPNDPDMKPERSELTAETPGFFLQLRLGGLADMVQVVNNLQWALAKAGWTTKSVHLENDRLEVHCVKA